MFSQFHDAMTRVLLFSLLLLVLTVPARAQGFFGTTTLLPFEISVNNERVLRLEPGSASDGPNVILGSSGNSVLPGVVGATISGGGDPFLGGSPRPNRVEDDYGTVGGGVGNTARGESSTIGGGRFNTASGTSSTVGGGAVNTASSLYSTVGGGLDNTASATSSTVPGGRRNAARGENSFAAGYYAKANHDGTFVWSDNSLTDADSLVSTAEDQFLIRATGGVGIGTNSPKANLHLFADSGAQPHLLLEENENGDFARLRLKNTSNTTHWDLAAGSTDNDRLNFFVSNGRGNVMSLRATGDPLVMYNGAKLTEGGTWMIASSRHLKTDFEAVDPQEVLARLVGLPVQTWRYKAEALARHMGPTAEAFASVFGLGDTDRGIATVDADGVALASIQGLHAIVEQQQDKIETQQAQIERQQGEIEKQQGKIEGLEAELATLRTKSAATEARLAALEAALLSGPDAK